MHAPYLENKENLVMATGSRDDEAQFSKEAEVVTDTLMVDLVSTKWRLFEYSTSGDAVRRGKVVRRWDSQVALKNRGKPARFDTKREAIDYAKRFLAAPSGPTT
jgi:hypothetical protein